MATEMINASKSRVETETEFTIYGNENTSLLTKRKASEGGAVETQMESLERKAARPAIESENEKPSNPEEINLDSISEKEHETINGNEADVDKFDVEQVHVPASVFGESLDIARNKPKDRKGAMERLRERMGK